MEESIIQVPLYTATSAWRKEAQLRGLLRNHPSVIANSGPLAAPGTVFSTARLSLHNNEEVLAVGLNPLGGSGSVGLMSIGNKEPTLEGAMRMRWLDMPSDLCLSSIEWCEQHVLVGSTRGRIFVTEASPSSVNESSGSLVPFGCLFSSETQPLVGDIVVTPNSYAASTLVRSVRCNAGINTSSVLAVVDSRAMIWDVTSSQYPVRTWSPESGMSDNSCNNNGQRDILLFAHWAPSSASVVLTGSYNGNLVLTDTRANDRGKQSLVLPLRHGYTARCADFNVLLPFVVAAASSDGTLSVFDCRFPVSAVRTFPSLQGDISSIKWLKLHSDILATGGIDGSVALWNLRFPPTYCVGRAQYKYPISDLAATRSSVEQRVFGVSDGGELTLTGLAQPALASLAASATERVKQQSGNNDVPHLHEREREGEGFLYTRRLREAYAIITDCAVERFARKDTAMAMALVGLIDVMVIQKFDYKMKIEEERVRRDLCGEATPYSQALQSFEDILSRSSERLCITLPLEKIRDLGKPDSEDLKKLEALRLNLVLQHVLISGDAGTVINSLQIFAANAGNLELVDSETACNIATMLLKNNFAEGEKFVRTLLSMLIQPDGTVLARTLTRRLLIVVQEPLLTAGLPPRKVKRHEDRFLRNISTALEAVQVQLTIQGMGIEQYQKVIATVNSYQGRCLEKGESGIFGWLAVKPLLLFLNSLTADSNYATFFWACVQLIEALAKCPAVRQVETLLFRTVDRINSAANRIRAEVEQAANTPRFSPPTLREAAASLRSVAEFLVVLLRVQLECENVAIESEMTEIPPLMTRIFDILSNASSDLLEAWSSLLDALGECTLRDLVRKCCLGVVREFFFKVEGLMAVSSKKEDDETLNEILDTCQDFVDKVISGDR
ncbi:uncharacterized protein TM35_000481310 [Trypanosoma theileri]|uniref:Uncharacterized protein n=1 Tax=Trypanosoma theileri TaxID=67003 RepID=A0A1X0NJ82_9TRYP|nr:uncharacterized protein TM35_000481310 [Trypanosoma theileri]ORC84170.1 hypothetical protein TM35_000481310 [Trypanosoma theileri]